MNKESKYNLLNENKDIKLIDIFRTGFSEEEILIDFACLVNREGSEDKDIKMISRVKFSPELLTDMITQLFLVGIEYKKKNKKSIGGLFEEIEK